MHLVKRSTEIIEFVQFLEAGMNAVVLIGASILFLMTFETRVKRARALKAIHELRSLTHVIDIHQLPKTRNKRCLRVSEPNLRQHAIWTHLR